MKPFAYAILRVVPRVERGESLNAGIVLFARQHDFLAARTQVDEERLGALAPGLDVAAMRARLVVLEQIAHGDCEDRALAALPPSERFGLIVAPSSTAIQPSEVHTGLTDDPRATLGRLFDRLVA